MTAFGSVPRLTVLIMTAVVGSNISASLNARASSSVSSSVATADVSPPPETVAATHLDPSACGAPACRRPGSGVRSAHLGARVFPDARHGFALATFRGATYPATTNDGGRSWRIDGPALHLPAAQAPLAVSEVGAAGAETYFAWGGSEGGSAVDVTTDGGKQWWQALLGDVVVAVVSGQHGRLVAVAQAAPSSTPSAQTWLYASDDGGRNWRYQDQVVF